MNSGSRRNRQFVDDDEYFFPPVAFILNYLFYPLETKMIDASVIPCTFYGSSQRDEVTNTRPHL